MKIFYSYEVEGIQRKDQKNYIEVSDSNPERGLTYDSLVNLLKQDRANINEHSVLCYYNQMKRANVTLKRGDVIPETDQIEIIIRRGHSQAINELLHRLDSLQHQVQGLEEKLEHKEQKISSQNKRKELVLKPFYSELDIAMLHAAPLFFVQKSNIRPYDESKLNFEYEKNFIIENLNKGDIRFEAGTPENFKELLEYMPKVIIISCQSYYKSHEGFVLAFEKHDLSSDGRGEIGLMHEINSSNLKKMLMAANQYLQVIILKGRYSQEMGNVLLSAGFSCVVCVHDIDESKDCLKFIVDFIGKLMDGLTIEQAFEITEKETLEKGFFNECCCAHQHKPDCLWVKKIQVSNAEKRHIEHSSTKCCGLKGSLHSTSCEKSLKFNSKYSNSRTITEEEWKNNHWNICCCSPELDHKKIKFSIINNDQSVLDQVLFEPNKKNKLEVRSGLSDHLKPQYIEKFMIGRRVEISDLILMTLSNRCVNVIGSCGIGKTMVIKKAGQYAYERRIFKDGVVYIDFLMRTDIIFLYRYIANRLNLPSFNSHKDLCNSINELDVLLIIDNIDPLLKQDHVSLLSTYAYIISNTTKPKFMIASQESLNLKDSKIYNMPPLTTQQASDLLKHFGEDNNITIPPEIFQSIGTKPADILQICPLFPKPGCEYILNLLQKTYDNKTNYSISISFHYLLSKIPESEDFLKILSYLPSGALNLNIKYLCEDIIPNYNEILKILRTEGKNTGIWFLHSDKDFEFVLLRSNVANYLENNLSVRPNMVRIILAHLAMFAQAILTSLLNSESSIGAEARSSLFFVNKGISYGMWKPQFIPKPELLADIKDPVEVFNKIEPNLWYYLNVPQLKKLLSIQEDLKKQSAEAIGDMVLTTTAIFILLGKTLDAIEMIKRARQFCKDFKLKRICNMLKITEASLSALYFDFPKACELIESAKEYFSKHDLEGEAECNLLKGLIKEALESQNELLLIRRFTNSTDVDAELNRSIYLFSEARQDLGNARAQLAYAEYNLKNEKNEVEILDSLKNAIDVFRKLDLVFWETRAVICLSDWYYHGHNWIVARNKLTSIVPKKEDVKHQLIISSKLVKINEMIRKDKKYVVALFKAFPIVQKTANNQINRIGSIWRTSSKFRSALQARLENIKKEVCIRMEIASRSKLKEYLNDRCIILHLTSDMFSSTQLFLEGPNGLADPLNFEEFYGLVGGSLKKHGVEVLVLCMPLSVQLGEYCHETLGVKHVICFNFIDYPRDGNPVQMAEILENAMSEFCTNFYALVIEGHTIRGSFTESKAVMEDYINKKIKEFPHLQLRGKTFEKWWNEYHKNEPILINEYSESHDECLLPIESTDGCFIEINDQRGPCNIRRKNLNTIVGRQVEIHNAIDALNNNNCIHVFGEEGIGKTEFVSQIGYFLNVRNKYPDGIFLLNLQRKSSLNELYDELLQKIGLTFYSSNIVPRTFLYKKKMLLILDNCDDLYQKAIHTFNSLLKMFLEECEISLIITTTIKIQTYESFNVKRFALRNLTNLESLVMLSLKSPQFTSQLLETELEQSQYEESVNEIIKDSRGLPKIIILWAKKIENANPKEILKMMTFRKLENNPFEALLKEKPYTQDFGQLELRRNSKSEIGNFESNSLELRSSSFEL
jgi:hypothetical protein